jgi:hypothetical protein
MVEKTAAFKQRRAEDTRRWRERLHRGAAIYPIEIDGTTFDLMERFGGLKASQRVIGRPLPLLSASCCASPWPRCCGRLLPGFL